MLVLAEKGYPGRLLQAGRLLALLRTAVKVWAGNGLYLIDFVKERRDMPTRNT